MARSHAVMRSAHVALRFDEGRSGITFQMFVDGNRNGVRTNDIASHVDQPLGERASLSDLFSGVAIAVSGAAGSDPLRIGSSNLLSFTPLGTATSGTTTCAAATARSSPSGCSAQPDACVCNATCRGPEPGSTLPNTSDPSDRLACYGSGSSFPGHASRRTLRGARLPFRRLRGHTRLR